MPIPAAGWAELDGRNRPGRCERRPAVARAGGGRDVLRGRRPRRFPGDAWRRSGSRALPRRRCVPRWRRCASLPIPTLALIEGHCYGAGVALAMACDIRIAALDRTVSRSPPPSSASPIRRRMCIGWSSWSARDRRRASCSPPCPFPVEEARTIGLVDYHMPREEALIEAILANDRESLQLLKESIRRAGRGVSQRFRDGCAGSMG